jgi:hypothetical protein
VGIYVSKTRENATEEVRQMLQTAMEAGYSRLEAYIERDLAAGRVSVASSGIPQSNS